MEKKLQLSKEEYKGVVSREIELTRLDYLRGIVNNDIVSFIKETAYKRLGLDTSKDYKISYDEKGMNLLVPEEDQKTIKKGEKDQPNE